MDVQGNPTSASSTKLGNNFTALLDLSFLVRKSCMSCTPPLTCIFIEFFLYSLQVWLGKLEMLYAERIVEG